MPSVRAFTGLEVWTAVIFGPFSAGIQVGAEIVVGIVARAAGPVPAVGCGVGQVKSSIERHSHGRFLDNLEFTPGRATAGACYVADNELGGEVSIPAPSSPAAITVVRVGAISGAPVVGCLVSPWSARCAGRSVDAWDVVRVAAGNAIRPPTTVCDGLRLTSCHTSAC